MARQNIEIGTAPTGAGGDTVRSANVKINANFTELYTQPAFPGVKITGAFTPGYGTQGTYQVWNAGEGGSLGWSGESSFINNRGGGSGGFTWRSVNADNSASGPMMSYSYAGVLNVPLALTLGGRNVVERGSNANGEYVRYADGTQICWKVVGTNSSGTYAVASGLYGSDAYGAGAYPAPFAAMPAVTCTGMRGTGSAALLIASNYTAASQSNWGTWRAIAADNTAVAGILSLVAIGRWF